MTLAARPRKASPTEAMLEALSHTQICARFQIVMHVEAMQKSRSFSIKLRDSIIFNRQSLYPTIRSQDTATRAIPS
ncbi:Autophagy-related protein 29 [Fusarium oxysporum f. sp. albedinis]|nr:Autophagy-related protein 29 [Fusarium oxysporum f. sp. albedinis]